MKFLLLPVLVLVLAAGASPLFSSQESETCGTIVREALSATDTICQGTGRNEACYGHVQIEAQPQRGIDADSFQFSSVGDRVDVTRLKSLRLSPMDTTAGTWGVALLKLQADIPTSMATENVDLLLFGDVRVQNAVDVPVLQNIQLGGIGNVNVRNTPSSSGFVLQALPSGSTLTARGRSRDGEWVYVELTDGRRGWVSRGLVRSGLDMESLIIANPRLEAYQPMQAFYLTTGPRTSACEQASNDGILIQTPEGVAEVRLWINEVKIRLGSTAFIQAMPNNQMVVKTIEGKAHVEAMGVQQTVPAGTGVSISMNSNLEPISAPSDPKPYSLDDMQNLPVEVLDRTIEIAEPIEVTPEIVIVVEPTATDLPTLAPTSTDVPTATLEPTATDAPTLTATDSPTDVPTATSTPEPTATDSNATLTSDDLTLTLTVSPVSSQSMGDSSVQDPQPEASATATETPLP